MKKITLIIVMMLVINPSLCWGSVNFAWSDIKLSWQKAAKAHKAVKQPGQDPKPARQLKPRLNHRNAKRQTTAPRAKESAPKPHRSPLGRLIKEKVPHNATEEVAIEYQQALQLLQQGKKAEASFALEQVLTKMPQHAEARTLLIDYYLDLKDSDKVAELLRDGLRLDPRKPGLIKQQALLLHEQGQYKQALSVLLSMPREQHADPEYKTLLALTYYHEGLFKLAQKYYSELLRQEPRNSRWLLGLAVTQDAAGGSTDALKNFSKVRTYGGLDSDTLKYIEQRISVLQEHDTSARRS